MFPFSLINYMRTHVVLGYWNMILEIA